MYLWNETTLKIGTTEHFIFNRKIIVKNAPHFQCSNCKEITFDIKTDMFEVLKYAYQNNLNEVDFDEFEK